MQRINWIDWVKAWCMTVVVFDHTPHDGSPFLLQFLAGTNLASFFFISGYLKKPVSSQKETLKKYAYCLLIPYLIYNAIFYPYWIGKTYIEQGGPLAVYDYVKPIIGTLLGQLDSSFSCQLNGVTWFLISLFALDNRHMQSTEKRKGLDVVHIHHCNDPLWSQQIYPFCTLSHVSRLSPLHSIFLLGQCHAPNLMAKRNKNRARICNRHNGIGHKSAPFLLAHPRRSFRTSHPPLLHREYHFYLCYHLSLALCQQPAFTHHRMDFHWHYGYIRPSSDHYGASRLWH